MTPDTDTNNPPPVQPVQPPVAAQAAKCGRPSPLTGAPCVRPPNHDGGCNSTVPVLSWLPTPDQEPDIAIEYAKLMAAELLCHAMDAAGVNGKTLAELADINPSEISRLKSGDRNVTVATLARLLSAMGFRLKLEAVPNNASAAPPAPAPAPVAAAKTMPLDDYLLLSGMLRISQQHARAWGLYDEQGNPIYPAGVLSHPFQADKLPATADAPALLRASLVQPAPVAADADLDALLALVRGMVATAKGADTQGAWAQNDEQGTWIDEADGGEVVADAMDHGDAAHIAACNPAAIQRLGELVERLVARCRQQTAPVADDDLGDMLEAAWGLIANAWDRAGEQADWADAAGKWRARYHAYLGHRRRQQPAITADTIRAMRDAKGPVPFKAPQATTFDPEGNAPGLGGAHRAAVASLRRQPASSRRSSPPRAPLVADDEIDALLALVRGMVATSEGLPRQVINDFSHVVACNPAAIQRLGELAERVAARCRQCRQAKGGA